MNLENIKSIVCSGDPNWELLLLSEIAKDKAAIPKILNMLNEERLSNQLLITELNFQLSRAHVALVEPKVNKDQFVQNEIKKFYQTGKISHCFANMD